jgi:hypothetical protein
MTHAAPGKTLFRFGDKTISVESDQHDLLDQIASLFPEYSTLEAHREVSVFRVARMQTRWLLQGPRPDSASRTFASRSRLVDELEFALTLEFLGSNPRAAYIHGSAALVRLDRAILVLGQSGAGKSTLGLKWCVDGHPVFGDDIVRLEPGGKISAFKRLFEVDTDCLKNLGIDPRTCPSWSRHSAEVWFDPRNYGGWADRARPVGLVVLVERSDKAGVHVSEVGADEALGWLSVSLMPEGFTVGECLDDLISLVKNARCCRAAVSDIENAADPLIELLG